MKLYYSQFTRSGRVRWLLEELGAPHELVRLSLRAGEHRSLEYLAIHPHGSVPALVDGDLTLTESSAIVLHLADKYPDARMAPALGSDARGEYYRWIVYVPATVDPVLETITMQTRFLPEARRDPAVLAAAREKFATIAGVLTRALAGRPFIVGEGFTAADVVVGSALGWARFIGALDDHPQLVAYLEALQQRPAYQRAHAD